MTNYVSFLLIFIEIQGIFFTKLRDLFFTKKLELVLVGLQNSGKSTFCNYLQLGKNDVAEPPTVGLNVKTMRRDGISFKIWDIGGQHQFRDEWARYCCGCDVIIFVVDTSDLVTPGGYRIWFLTYFDKYMCPRVDRLPEAKIELHRLLEDHELNKIPLLVLANKVDIAAIKEPELIKSLNLDYIVDNPWVLTPVSATRGDNIDSALQFLISHSKSS